MFFAIFLFFVILSYFEGFIYPLISLIKPSLALGLSFYEIFTVLPTFTNLPVNCSGKLVKVIKTLISKFESSVNNRFLKLVKYLVKIDS